MADRQWGSLELTAIPKISRVFVGGPFLVASMLALSACAGETDPAQLATGALEALPKAAFEMPEGLGAPKGSATDIYSRVARGALTCWLGANGPLRKTHMFHASADPPAKGGKSKIVIFELRKGGKQKRGARAFVVSIVPDGATANVGTENVRMPPKIGAKMRRDVYRWSAAQLGCLKGGVVSGWNVESNAKSKKNKKKSKKK